MNMRKEGLFCLISAVVLMLIACDQEENNKITPPEENAEFHLSLCADPEIIQSGDGEANSRIFGFLLDRELNAVANDTLYAAANLGFIASRMVTDASGYFEMIYYGINDPGDGELPVSITACYQKNGLILVQNTVTVTIIPPH